MTTSVTLYQFALCPFCNKVKAGLEIKGIPYETVEVSPRSKSELPELPEGSPKKVPVIKIGDKVISDSTEILKELDLAFPDTLPFRDETIVEEADRIASWVDKEFISSLPPVLYGSWAGAAKAASIIARSSKYSFAQGIGTKLGGPVIMHMVAKRLLKKSGRSDAQAWVTENLETFENWLGEQDFVCGDQLSVADVAMFGAIQCVREFPIFNEISSRPGMRPWLARMEGPHEQKTPSISVVSGSRATN